MRVALVDSQYDTGAAMFDGGRRGDWDTAFVNLDINSGQAGMAYTPAYVEIDQTYLVPRDSPYRSVADIDRVGVRVATFSPSPIEGFLKQNLTKATIVQATSIADGVRLIEFGQADVYAASRAELVEGGWRLADGRVLDDSITRFHWGVAVASSRADLLAYVTQFLEYAKSTGVIQDATNKHGVAGARVAP